MKCCTENNFFFYNSSMRNFSKKHFFSITFSLALFFSSCYRQHKPEIKDPPPVKAVVPVKEFSLLMDELLHAKNINSGQSHQLVQSFFSKYPNSYFTSENYEFFSESPIHNGALYPGDWYSYKTADTAYSDFHLTLDSVENSSSIKYVLSISSRCSFNNRISVSSPWTHEKNLDVDVFVISKKKNKYDVIWEDHIYENFSARNSLPFKIISENGQHAIYYEWNKGEGTF